MISGNGEWWYTKSHRYLKQYFKLDFIHRSVMNELMERRATKRYEVTFGGNQYFLEPKQVLVSERALALETGLDRSKFQRILRRLRNENLIRRIAKTQTDGTIFYIPDPDEIPALIVLQKSLVSHPTLEVSSQKQKENKPVKRDAKTSVSHQMSHLGGILSDRFQRENNSCKPSSEPLSEPLIKKNAYKNSEEKMTNRINSLPDGSLASHSDAEASSLAANAALGRQKGGLTASEYSENEKASDGHPGKPNGEPHGSKTGEHLEGGNFTLPETSKARFKVILEKLKGGSFENTTVIKN